MKLPHMGWSEKVYPLEAGDVAAQADYSGEAIPEAALPSDPVLLYIRPDGPDVLLRGRSQVMRLAAENPRQPVSVRLVFKPSVAKWNLFGTLVRVLRNRYRFRGTGRYHVSVRALRELGVERVIRSIEKPQRRGKQDRKAAMNRLMESLKRDGYDESKPIHLTLCRTWGVKDSVRQGHHRISVCLACGIDRVPVFFSAAGVLPRVLQGKLRSLAFASTSSTVANWNLAVEKAAGQGLSNCRVLLENKYINDVFYSGVFKDRACIVKCSSKCPWSIGNEYRLARRMFEVAPQVVAEPLMVQEHPAFVVSERVVGPSLTELLKKGISEEQADSFARDIRELAQALKRTGILHRDLFADNLLLGSDGHLKAIDWQLAIDRADYREDPWVARNWKFRYVVFGVNRELGLGVWNDFHALGKILAQFPQTDAVKAVRAELAAGEAEMTFAAPPSGLDRVRLWLYGWSLRLQMLLKGRKNRKYAQLERRLMTVRQDYLKIAQGAPSATGSISIVSRPQGAFTDKSVCAN